ncbi:hypothetical protein RE6C_00491 [Rhodopirellula europaea 6C]|uniref:Uncharacterized protein n=1 Tax=Rhodopirellula europaea 6C TaxID=1263867 RepID=M2ANI9_9BACT|nr:hypothetical protein RE6C_00491 [Rhodopirellula europaea 6C]
MSVEFDLPRNNLVGNDLHERGDDREVVVAGDPVNSIFGFPFASAMSPIAPSQFPEAPPKPFSKLRPGRGRLQ